jgi:sugar phosphate isomerase/epimerase
VLPLSLTTDFVSDSGCPQPALRAIADAGFSHVHWCHQWCTDFLYGPAETAAIGAWLREYHLAVNDIHGSAGKEKNWGSALEHERLAGIELVRNRIDLAEALGSDVLIMHLPAEPAAEPERTAYWDRLRRTLDILRPYARAPSVRLALENMPQDNFPTLRRVLTDYPPDYIGLCYDCGHGNIAGNGLAELGQAKDRLIATHLHDNDGISDQHWPLFTGTVDWQRLATIIAQSAYAKPCPSIEATIKNVANKDAAAFLHQVRDSGVRFAQMIARQRESRAAPGDKPC